MSSEAKKKHHLLIMWQRLAQSPLAVAGTLIFLFFLLMALIGPYVAPFPFDAQNIANRLQSPSWEHWCGTDQYGRDIFSRILVGARGIFLLGGSGTLLAAFFGSILGLCSGYYGGIFDEVIMRGMDILMSFPALLLALVFLSLLGPSLINLIMIVAIIYIPILARLLRSMTLELKSRAFVEAAVIRGESAIYILLVEIFPNTLPPLFVEISMRFSYAIFLVASLGFLGLGVQPPSPDWGLQINEARSLFSTAPWVLLYPAAAISILVISTSLFSDGLRSMLQPAMGKR